ncbi:hypothetical protein [Streptococcus pneumoniae]|uniref:hypothetical protein n=1 Tax=Streptococcus pneumoniae TaxID=1313 RepID=UPI00186AB9D5|nr:hypothetical protein [Streptococcus pneumoniae]
MSSKHCFEVVDRTDEVSSKHVEVVDRTDEVSSKHELTKSVTIHTVTIHTARRR